MGLLAELFVQFSAKGVSAVSSALGTVKAGFGAVAAAAGTATAGMMGFATAGLAASAEGQRISTLMELLSREIGSLFLPAIEAGTKALEKITRWFQGLSQAQFDVISGFAMAAGGAAAFGAAGFAIGGPWGAAIGGIVGAIGGLLVGTEAGRAALEKLFSAGQRLFEVLGPPLIKTLEAIAGIITSVVVPAVEFLASVIETVAKSLDGLFGKTEKVQAKPGHRTLTPTGGGMESITDTYTRIQMRALKDAGRDYAKETAENTAKLVERLDQAERTTGEVRDAVRAQRPVLAK